MAAGPGAASSGHSGGRGSSTALESSLDRRFQGVTNTMESIQGLSSWCIENKKHHSLVVRCWMKWLKKSDANHRLNLFYLANDVIQNCKRKNAIIYRTTFADVLPDAALLVKDAKVCKSVDRIFSIWQERNVYPEELISELKASLQKKDKEKEKDKEKQKEKEKKVKEQQPCPAPVKPKTALKSKIVAEFVPHDFVERLMSYKNSLDESDLREKQLAALRVDVCSTEALKRLKDKAGGNKFSKDFEEGSTKLQEFVTFLEGQIKAGPPLLEALGNADIFYEMQYKEVKIVANAYKAFANRVSSLKRKLDALKTTLPSLDDSPIPSPSEDAPSPTGSESPFHGLSSRIGSGSGDGNGGRGVEQQKDNRDIEDMDMSEEEETTENAGIIVGERKEKSSLPSVSKMTNAATKSSQITASKPSQVLATPTKTVSGSSTSQTPPANTTTITTTPVPAPVVSPSPLQVNLANVDLGKISSILSSISNAMKTTGVSPVSRPSPGTPTTPSSHASSSKAPPLTPGSIPSSNPLASILSKVDFSPENILNVLTKTQTHSPNLQGLSSLLSSARSGTLTTPDPVPSSPASSAVTTTAATSTTTTPTTPKALKTTGNNFKRETEREKGREWEKVKEREREKEREQDKKEREKEIETEAVVMPSLESKINSFLQGNPGFSALGLGLDDVGSNSPLLVGGDNLDGTPVRDESGSTPTQDEIMDSPHVLSEPQSADLSGGHNLSPTAYHSDPWDAVITPREALGENEQKDRDYRTPPPSRLAALSPSATKPVKAMSKAKEEEGLKRKVPGLKVPSAAMVQDHKIKAKMDGEGEKSACSRKPSGGSDDGMKDKERKASADNGDHYHRIETVVSSSSSEGAPIETLDYGNRIQTVESIRVVGRVLRRGSSAGSRVGGAWYEEEEFMEAPPPHHPGSRGHENSEELGMVPPLPPPPLPAHLPPPSQYPPPPYAKEDPTRPSHVIPQHHPPPPFFPSSIPPVQPPLPPIPQTTHPSRDFPLTSNTTVMVGGVLVSIDRVLPYPPANLHPDGAGHGGSGGSAPPRGSKPQLPSLLGDPPRPGTVKEQFVLRHTPPLHRPGTPGVPPPLLGRIREGPIPTPPSPSTPTTPTPPSPAGETHPHLSIPNRLPINNPNQRPRRPSSPLPLLQLPNQHHLLRSPQFPRGSLPLPPPSLNREPLLPGTKRPAGSFGGGSFNPPKRPFLPPRY
ncbi:regulation of nuclear pre-mRNA domain-containing protein 2-like [Carassius carassius]|uniref:regulation of nuclear pre-mRNA domain-containing protein 2-like n=1 Tax=Carassius carassius TaxID=217509 RepID=UPI00286928F8|nr:regulation of nuclear pre-mRNA domain-containing protein 2-like [Carassius carassius]XP_059363280.1 regulation of nuclear pre-mRNA domain-containing protein 2-like [Carassius carassius]XP_059363281.1 regulation of nuclear pre-mRNA domain-containing protein 2-like [Carassius carassius]XP_059363282.1 regulation of nuclear pre-mRNA domain-containing protein 2-like [Carassius carassius]XP_059363283.1 regulation of nuclear pre-mRNA domain-containing protein 2-like [Carassius carassius]